MADSGKTNELRRSRLERTLISRFASNSEAYEEALDYGVQLGWFRDPQAKMGFDAIRTFWEDHPGHCPGLEYLKDHAVPYDHIVVQDTTIVLVHRLKDIHIASELEFHLQVAQRLLRHDPSGALDGVLSQVSQLSEESRGNRKEPSDSDLTKIALANYQRRELCGGVIGIPWPFPSLNQLTGGILPKTLVVLYGRKKAYKSTLLFFVALWHAQQGHRVYLASGELPREQVWEILLCMHAVVPLDKYRLGALGAEEKVRLYAGADSLNILPITVGKTPRKGAAELDLISRRAEKFGAEIVVLDGAHLLPESREWQDIGDYGDRILQRALDGPPWLVAVQANRTSRQLAKDSSFDIADTDQDIGGGITWVQHCAQSFRIRKVDDGRADLDLGDNRMGHSRTIPLWVEPGIRICERV